MNKSRKKSTSIMSGVILLFSLLAPFVLPEIIAGLRSFFTFGEKMMLAGLVLLCYLLPIVIRVISRLTLLNNMIILHEKDNKYCPITGEQHCCIDNYGMELSNSGNGTVEITKNKFLSNYKLTIESKINEIEKDFSSNLKQYPNKEIWIFSYNLWTEVLNDKSQNIAAENVNKGIKYIYFHTNNPEEQDGIEKNKIKICSQINEDKRTSHIEFIPLEDTDIVGLDIFDHIIGSIIFVSPLENSHKLSYFSLRGNDKPIYYQLPYCMNKNYYNYFEGRKKQYENTKSSGRQ